MDKKFGKISRQGWVLLAMTLLFLLVCLGWYHRSGQMGAVALFPGPTRQTAQRAPTPPAPGMLEGEKLNINTAGRADLTRLPGIGEKKAEAIVRWRQENGFFAAPEDLMQVRGIGEGILETIAPYITTE